MKNIFILFVFIIGAFCSNCKAETLPSTSIIPIENAAPIHYAYAKDYFDKLYEKFDGKSLGIFGDYSIAYVDIDKSGKILDIRGFDYITSPFFGFKLRKLLRDNPPPPFYEGMESEKITLVISINAAVTYIEKLLVERNEEGTIMEGRKQVSYAFYSDLTYFPRYKYFWLAIRKNTMIPTDEAVKSPLDYGDYTF